VDIAEHQDEIFQCNRCGFCQTACPVFRSTGHEAGVARGRLALLRAILEDRILWTEEIEEPLFNCLLCGACTSNCFPGIETADLIARARSQYLEKVGRKSIHRLLFDFLLPYPRRLHLAARAAAVGKNSGISDVAQALGLLRFLGRDFQRADEIINNMPARPFRGKFKPGEYNGSGKNLKIAYFVGCGVDVIQHRAAEATFQVLRKTGKSITILDNCCCGLPAWSYGDVVAAGKMAERNLKILTAGDFDAVVTDCSSCASFLKKQARLFPEKTGKYEMAQAVSHRIKDMAELVSVSNISLPSSDVLLKVTYHDPCHAARGQKLITQPRDLLKAIPGLDYTELPEADWCCGGAGAYALSHYTLSRSVLDRKMDNVKKTGAQVLVTSCPACMIHLSYGVRKHGLEIEVRHLSEMVNRLDHSDVLSL